MQRLSAIAFFLFLSLTAHADDFKPFEGIAIFAAHSKRFPCARALSALRGVERPAIQTLYGTFGSRWGCVRRFANRFKDRPHLIAVNMLNGPNRRGRGLFQGEIAPRLNVDQFDLALKNSLKLDRSLNRRGYRVAKAINGLRNENTVFRLYPELEDNLSNQAFKSLSLIFANYFRQDEIYRSAFRNKSFVTADGIELHGFDERLLSHLEREGRRPGGACSWSNDGIGVDVFRRISGQSYVSLPEMLRTVSRLRNARCDIFVWDFRWQGIGERFTKPLDRRFEFNRRDAQIVRRILRRKDRCKLIGKRAELQRYLHLSAQSRSSFSDRSRRC